MQRTDTLFPYTTPFRSHGTSGTTGTTSYDMEGRERGTGGAERPEWSGHRRQETDYDISHHIRSRAQLRRVAAQCPNRKRPGCRCRTGSYDRPGRLHHPERSEEHTSELQSLMRISYSVLCL